MVVVRGGEVVVVDGGGGGVVGGAVVGGAVVDGRGAVVVVAGLSRSPSAVVEVVSPSGVDVDDVLVVGITASTLPMGLPPNFVGLTNSPVSTPSVTSAMNRLKMVAGSVPPEIFLPRTDVIFRELPSGYPIQTAVVSFGV